jgi:2-polyprenyl-6-methoxyphenol hydroxylase-like FAD-dependent oxidoreductase
MLLQNKMIAIVGGGPGGLALARLLQLKSVNVKVYERDADRNARLIGSPLDMHEGSGLEVIRKAGLMDAFRQNFRPGADRMVIVNEQAELFFSDHDTQPLEDFGNAHFRPEIDRGPLRNIFLDSLHAGTVVWDSHFLSMEVEGEGWLLHFKNGSTAYADMVVAADGANSKIRPYITNIKPFYSGITMLEGNVQNAKETAPEVHALANGGKVMAFGNTKNILLGQKGNGDIGFYASFKVDENWAKNSGLDYANNIRMLEWFKATYAEWSHIWYELFENASIPFIPRPIYCMPLNQSWKPMANLTMIGDAAHVMPPFAGEGANMAMLDALLLSDALTSNNYKTVQEAISFYETGMRKRVAIAAQESLDNGERMHSKNALSTMLAFFIGYQSANSNVGDNTNIGEI